MDSSGIEKVQAFAAAQFRAKAKGKEKPPGERPVVTLSRQAGSGGTTVAEAIASYLTSKSPKGAVPWTVFDKKLVEKVLEEHGLPQEVAQFMPEEHAPSAFGLDDAVEEILGLHPSRWRLVNNTTRTLLSLAQMGSCILVGRGGNVITAHMPGAFHVRLVGTPEKRIEYVRQNLGLTAKSAKAFVEKEDAGRARYMKKYFKKDVDDPTLYHLVVNTDCVGYDEAARIVGDTVLARAKQG